MSKRKGKTNIRLAILNEINTIDKKLKRKKIREDAPIEEMQKLLSQRDTLTSKLKTK